MLILLKIYEFGRRFLKNLESGFARKNNYSLFLVGKSTNVDQEKRIKNLKILDNFKHGKIFVFLNPRFLVGMFIKNGPFFKKFCKIISKITNFGKDVLEKQFLKNQQLLDPKGKS